MEIHLEPGKKIKRRALHKRYGGREQGGISPSAKFDGQRDDGLYDYTGEGQSGDQTMTQGNRVIRDHGAEGRELHLFEAGSQMLKYVGQFEYVDHYTADAPQKGKSDERSVIVFRLRPIGTTTQVSSSPLEQLDRTPVKALPVERLHTEQTLVEPNREPYKIERREQKLVLSYEAFLLAQGHDICRLQLWPEDEPSPFLSDLYDETTNTLIEAKSSIARPAFRMAIGQLADYARMVKPAPKKAILLPQKPRPDLLALAEDQGIAVIWADGIGGFASSRPASP